jgi:beta-N-acetylhexosaminidase
MPEVHIGDVLPLRAGVIYDHNGKPVPDGTPVNFIFSYGRETTSIRQTAYTQKGIARTTYSIAVPGTLEISAESENAHSQAVKLDIPNPVGGMPTPSPSPEPTQTPTTIPPTPTTQPVAPPSTPPAPVEPVKGLPGLGEWIIAVMISIGLSLGIYRASAQYWNIRWGVRAGLLACIGGFLAYLYLALDFPGSETILGITPPWGIVLFSSLGVSLGLAAAMTWQAINGKFNRKKMAKSPGSAHQSHGQADQ